MKHLFTFQTPVICIYPQTPTIILPSRLLVQMCEWVGEMLFTQVCLLSIRSLTTLVPPING